MNSSNVILNEVADVLVHAIQLGSLNFRSIILDILFESSQVHLKLNSTLVLQFRKFSQFIFAKVISEFLEFFEAVLNDKSALPMTLLNLLVDDL